MDSDKSKSCPLLTMPYLNNQCLKKYLDHENRDDLANSPYSNLYKYKPVCLSWGGNLCICLTMEPNMYPGIVTEILA